MFFVSIHIKIILLKISLYYLILKQLLIDAYMFPISKKKLFIIIENKQKL